MNVETANNPPNTQNFKTQGFNEAQAVPQITTEKPAKDSTVQDALPTSPDVFEPAGQYGVSNLDSQKKSLKDRLFGHVKDKAEKKAKKALVKTLVKKGLTKAAAKGVLSWLELLKSHFEATYKAIQQCSRAGAVGKIEDVMSQIQKKLNSNNPKEQKEARSMLKKMIKQAQKDPKYKKVLMRWFQLTDNTHNRYANDGKGGSFNNLFLKARNEMNEIYQMYREGSFLYPAKMEDHYPFMKK